MHCGCNKHTEASENHKVKKKKKFPKDSILPVVKDKFLCFDPFMLLQSLQVKLKFILVVTNCQRTTTEIVFPSKRMNYFPEKK